MFAPAETDPTCPRCGYDQRGVIAAWRDSCPLRATCTECGLRYSCAELLVPEKFEPPWCIEYCKRRKRVLLRAAAETCARSLLPWRFWSRLKMSDPIQPRRIAAYVVILALVALVVPMVLEPVSRQWMAAVATWNAVHSEIAEEIAEKQREIQMLQSQPRGLVRALRGFSEEERERLIAEAERDIEARVPQIQAQIDNPPVVDHSLPLAILEAIFLPLAEESLGRIVQPDGTADPYPSPFEIWASRTGGVPGIPRARAANDRRTFIWLGVLIYLAFPLTLALLPVSRRRAKVRWAHIWRVTAYGAIVPVAAILISALATLVAQSGAGPSRWLPLPLAFALVSIGMVIWWTCAVDRYMKMPHAFWVAALHTLVALFLVLVPTVWVHVLGIV